MNLDIQKWKEFQIGRLFHVEYGNSFELESCEETAKDDPEKVNFVARTRENNGVTAYVKRIPNVEPSAPGIITVAGSGSSTLSTFVQEDWFYSGYHLFLLIPRENLHKEAKQFICICLELNKYKYWYGRQANKTLPFIEIKLPIQHNSDGTDFIDDSRKYSDDGYVPDWQFMEDYIKSLHHKPLTTQNKPGQVPILNVQDWKDFKIRDLFDVELSKGDIKLDEMDSGDIPLVSSGETNNGVVGFIDSFGDGKAEILPSNRITIDMFGNAFYQNEQFYAVSHGRINILNPKFELTRNIGLFICAVIKQEQYKYSYGRAVYSSVAEDMDIKLPVDFEGNPDWQFMENYMKSLPYGDRLEG